MVDPISEMGMALGSSLLVTIRLCKVKLLAAALNSRKPDTLVLLLAHLLNRHLGPVSSGRSSQAIAQIRPRFCCLFSSRSRPPAPLPGDVRVDVFSSFLRVDSFSILFSHRSLQQPIAISPGCLVVF